MGPFEYQSKKALLVNNKSYMLFSFIELVFKEVTVVDFSISGIIELFHNLSHLIFINAQGIKIIQDFFLWQSIDDFFFGCISSTI